MRNDFGDNNDQIRHQTNELSPQFLVSNDVTNKGSLKSYGSFPLSESCKDKVVKASSGSRRGYDDLEKGNKQTDQAVEDETDYSYEEDQARGPWTAGQSAKSYGTNRPNRS